MPEEKQFLRNIIGKEARKRYTTAGTGEQAFCLRADFKDGRKRRATAWSHFSDYEWSDEGDRETLTIIFGMRIVTIEGHRLNVFVRAIDEGKLKTFEELISAEALALQQNPDEEPIVMSVDIYPTFKNLIEEIKGEEKGGHDNGPETGFAKRFAR
jgi:hypothetical protein